MNRLREAREIMDGFARDTGVDSDAPPRRYLWTDAFAVCELFGLHRRTGEPRYRELALLLVDQVHRVLGRHRPDDARTGWISGLADDEGERHPTAGGLRIGKPLPERAPGAPYDPSEEWDRDGQYYHYLTKWMVALEATCRATGAAQFLRWAVELARASFAAFARVAGGRAGILWKMSIDLSRPLVPSMGAFDPMDGFVVLSTLEASRRELGEEIPTLAPEIEALASMCAGGQWATDDPLGIGGMLVSAYRLACLPEPGPSPGRPAAPDARDLRAALLEQSVPSMDAFERSGTLRRPADARLPFRELGLAIGLLAVERVPPDGAGRARLSGRESAALEYLRSRGELAERIAGFWLDPANRGPTWRDHLDINAVMLATALLPDGYLDPTGSSVRLQAGPAETGSLRGGEAGP